MPREFPVYLWQPFLRHGYFCFHEAAEQKKFSALLNDCIRHLNHGRTVVRGCSGGLLGRLLDRFLERAADSAGPWKEGKSREAGVWRPGAPATLLVPESGLGSLRETECGARVSRTSPYNFVHNSSSSFLVMFLAEVTARMCQLSLAKLVSPYDTPCFFFPLYLSDLLKTLRYTEPLGEHIEHRFGGPTLRYSNSPDLCGALILFY